jgi:YgiT-type zinc finger domain-containing protein
MKAGSTCPACGEGTLRVDCTEEPYRHPGAIGREYRDNVPCLYCDVCGAEWISHSDLEAFEARARAALGLDP